MSAFRSRMQPCETRPGRISGWPPRRDQREQDDDENDEAGHAAGLVDPTPRLSP